MNKPMTQEEIQSEKERLGIRSGVQMKSSAGLGEDRRWDLLEVGECFDVPGDKTSKVSSARKTAEARTGFRFKTEKVVEGNEAFIRVFRVNK